MRFECFCCLCLALCCIHLTPAVCSSHTLWNFDLVLLHLWIQLRLVLVALLSTAFLVHFNAPQFFVWKIMFGAWGGIANRSWWNNHWETSNNNLFHAPKSRSTTIHPSHVFHVSHLKVTVWAPKNSKGILWVSKIPLIRTHFWRVHVFAEWWDFRTPFWGWESLLNVNRHPKKMCPWRKI